MTRSRLSTYAALSGAAVSAALCWQAPAFAAEIAGRITSAENGAALAGAIVRIEELGHETTTSEEGYYAFTDVPAGAYSLSVDYLGADAASRTITISAKQSRTLDIALRHTDPGLNLTGQRGALAASLNRERVSVDQIRVTRAAGVGIVSDANAAELATRMPGVSAVDVEGQARFPIIRGLEGDLIATSLDGVRLTSTEGGDRRAALDIIDSNLIDRITVVTSRTPDMDGDSIGGLIEVSTLSAFDMERPQFRLTAEGLYDEIREEWGSNIVASGSNTLASGLLGVSGAVAVRDRTEGVDKVQVTNGQWSTDDALAYPQTLALVNDDITRELTTGVFTIETRPSEAQRFFFHLFVSDAREQSFRNRLVTDFDGGIFSTDDSVLQNGVAVIDGTDDVLRDVREREERREIRSLRFGGASQWRDWTFDYAASITRAELRAPSDMSASFRFDGSPLAVGVDVSNRQTPVIDAETTDLAFYDSDAFFLDEIRTGSTTVEDDEFTASFDVKRDWRLLGPDGYLKFGYKGRQREKSRDVQATVFTEFGETDEVFLLSSFIAPTGEIDYQLSPIEPGPSSTAVSQFVEQNSQRWEANAVSTAVADNADDYRVEEDINAGYVMAQFDAGRLKLVGGARVEDTEFDTRTVVIITAPDGVAVPGLQGFEQIAASNGQRALSTNLDANDTYTDFLPSLHGVFDMTKSVRLRFGYYQAAARPNFSDVAPSGSFTVDTDGSLSGVFGNPSLERQTADVFDVGVQWFLPHGSVSANAFSMDIDDYIAVQRFQGQQAVDFIGFGDAGAGVDISTAVNVSNARVQGLELSYQQALTFLPGLLDGVILGANYTALDGETTLRSADGAEAGRKISLPKLSDSLYNIIVGYDRGPVELRATAAYRSGYLDVIDYGGPGVDRFIDDFLRLDLSASVELAQGLQVFGAFTNLDDEPLVAYVRGPDGEFTTQFDEYGFTGNLGLTYTY